MVLWWLLLSILIHREQETEEVRRHVFHTLLYVQEVVTHNLLYEMGDYFLDIQYV